MLPYFAAAGHNLYAKSAYVYLQTMTMLPETHPDVHQKFEEGYHVVRRIDRYWGGLFTDLIIKACANEERKDARRPDTRKGHWCVI